MTDQTPSDEQIRALCDAATPGPWEARDLSDDDGGFNSRDRKGWWWVWRAGIPHYAGVMEVDQKLDKDGPFSEPGFIGNAAITDYSEGEKERADAEFIAAARSLVPALLDRVVALQTAIDRLEALCNDADQALLAEHDYSVDTPDSTVPVPEVRSAIRAHLNPFAAAPAPEPEGDLNDIVPRMPKSRRVIGTLPLPAPEPATCEHERTSRHIRVSTDQPPINCPGRPVSSGSTPTPEKEN